MLWETNCSSGWSQPCPCLLAFSPQVKAVREAAAAAGSALVATLNPHAANAAAGLLLAGAEQVRCAVHAVHAVLCCTVLALRCDTLQHAARL